MVLNYRKHQPNINKDILKDARGDFAQIHDKLRKKDVSAMIIAGAGMSMFFHPWFLQVSEILLFWTFIYYWWLHRRPKTTPFKMPKSANKLDPNNKAPGTGKPQMADGILYMGNDQLTKEEVWFTNSDARTHILYLGTTGAGKTEGLKSMVTNAFGWGSGFIYIDGKADTGLWGSISALARRYGRDDDLLILNYMTGNSDRGSVSNSINPFSLGSASYLTNLLVSLMPDVQGDNAMWKDRAVALMSAFMPALTWRRDVKEVPLGIESIRDELTLANIIKWARDTQLPEKNRKEIRSYLDNLPGYRDEFFNDDGSPRAAANGQQNDTSTVDQQHGYLTMQFTKQLQSLAGDYGHIFMNPHADIDIMDVVLNRRVLVVLIPALEKSADEAANLGKIVAALIKGMMGSTLGSAVEGDTSLALDNRPTTAPTPFMTVFDEVGYYATTGMAVMAAQARSLGFSMIFAGQDLPALEKRIKEEARSITANCNIKIFGKLEDPTQTKEFFEKTVGKALVLESNSRKMIKTVFGSKVYEDTDSFSLTARDKADYDDLKGYDAGEAVICFGDHLVKARMFYSDPGKIKSLRVNRFVALQHPDPLGKRGSRDVEAILERFRDKNWTAENAHDVAPPPPAIRELAEGFALAREQRRSLVESGAYALTWMAYREGHLTKDDIPDPALAPKETPAAIPQSPVPHVAATPALSATEPALVAEKPVAAAPPPPAPKRVEPVVAEPPPSPPKPATPSPQKKRDDDDDDSGVGTDEAVSWQSLLGSGGKSSKDDDDGVPDPDKMSPEAKAAMEKAMAEHTTWDALIGNDEAKKPAPAAAPLPGGIPATSFGFGSMGGYGIQYGGTAATPATAPAAPAPSPETKTPTTPLSAQNDEDEDDDDDNDPRTREAVNWNDLF